MRGREATEPVNQARAACIPRHALLHPARDPKIDYSRSNILIRDATYLLTALFLSRDPTLSGTEAINYTPRDYLSELQGGQQASLQEFLTVKLSVDGVCVIY
ncbi:hypothetical protein EVAR_55652_1 [Eumeta japonica]|uniref:Uncharacterized protein n=1 Tax=Eumeta variegata TaxID=151549 RepID=A0A4C1Y1U7_EUMVA|nr:hypothetical protein EVAR_55652_1 [Eumeta japonica]